MPTVNTVYFDPAVGGTGLTVSDDGNPVSGLDNNGHRYRFVPSLQNVVYIAGFVKQRALDVDGAVQTVNDKLDAAINAQAVSEANARDAEEAALLAKDWASKEDFPVEGSLWSAKEYSEQAKSISDSMTNNIGLSRVDGGDAFNTLWPITIDGGGAATVHTVGINCGNAI